MLLNSARFKYGKKEFKRPWQDKEQVYAKICFLRIFTLKYIFVYTLCVC